MVPASSPWSQIVRNSSEPEAMIAIIASPSPSSSPLPESPNRKLEADAPEAAAPPASDTGTTSNAVASSKKPAWRKPSNGGGGVVEAEPEPVMGAVSWPALSESARASPRSTSSDSLKVLSEGSVSVSVSLHKPINTNTNPNINPNHTLPAPAPVRQKSIKRSGSGSGSANNGGVTTSVSPPPPSVEVPQAVAVPDSSPRHFLQKRNNNWESGSKEPMVPQYHNGNSHPRNSYRRGNGGGPHPRGGGGEGPYHNNYGNRRDHEWNHHRSFNGRDGHIQQQQRFVPRNFHRPSPQFVGPSSIRPYGNTIGYPDMSPPYVYVQPPPPPPESFRGGVQYFAHAMPPVYYPQYDPQLLAMLVKQIDYYFSSENLCKDPFLRQKMDKYGWVSISLIAGFNLVKHLTEDIQCIMTALQTSTVVEVQGDKLRKRNDWSKWLLPSSNPRSSESSSETSKLDLLAVGIQSIGLEGSPSDSNSRSVLVDRNVSSKSSYGESINK